MGITAYNRGTKALQEMLDREQPSPALRLMRDLSDYSADHATQTLFAPTVIRFGPTPGTLSLMNRADRGWGERSMEYRSLWAIARAWRLVFLGLGRDTCGAFVIVHPLR